MLQPSRDGWSAEDWHTLFDERLGLAEFGGRLPRAEAEAQAFASCVVKWLNRNPVRSAYGRCIGCGKRPHAYDPLVPFGTESTGHAWLHSNCWPTWHNARKAEAIAPLTALGIYQPRQIDAWNENCQKPGVIDDRCP